MATIRTINFLPEIFQTPVNAEFLAATLDQLVNEPNKTKLQGFVGSKLGYGINALDYYVTEPTKVRTDYQLEPGIVFTKKDSPIAQDFISYPGIIDSIKLHGGLTDNNSDLFESQFYSWDSFTDLDKLVNYTEYYWLPGGPPAVSVAATTLYNSDNYVVTNNANSYNVIAKDEDDTGPNPIITLLRGGTYTFQVNQNSPFYIQTELGTSGFSATKPNVSTREVFGVIDNGNNEGFVTFNVPSKDDQAYYNFPYTTNIDLVTSVPFDQINGKVLKNFSDPSTGKFVYGVDNIDGVTDLEGLRIMFYNTGVANETGYVSAYYDENSFDINNDLLIEPKTVVVSGTTNDIGDDYITLAAGYTTAQLIVNQTITFTNPVFGGIVAGQVYYVKEILNSTDFTISETLEGTVVALDTQTGSMTANINQGQYEDGFYTTVNENFYRIQYVGDPKNPTLRLLPDGAIPIEENIVPKYGTEYIGKRFYKNNLGVINLVPLLTSFLDTLYYQDGTNPDKNGIIKLIDNDTDNFINVSTEILGKANYTSPNGVVFTNGLKVAFDSEVFPTVYNTGDYYVEGVGTSIELIPVNELLTPELFTIGAYNPWDIGNFGISSFDITLNLPIDPDYITIARNSINRNAWSRSNRWFHIDVINKTAQYNNNPAILTTYATQENKAKRPIIEFYPNLKLFNSGATGKLPVDFIDTRQTDALSNVSGSTVYYPDVEVYTANSAVISNTITPPLPSASLVVGESYVITNLGNTNWNQVADTFGATYQVGDKIVCRFSGVAGTGTATLLATGTTIIVPTSDITGTFQIGMYVGDNDNLLPTNTQISNITIVNDNTVIDVTWPTPENILTTFTTGIVGTDATVNNYGLFTGARIIFANDSNPDVVNNIYVVDQVSLTPNSDPVIVLTLAEDGNAEYLSQTVVYRGYYNRGKSFFYNGTTWVESQQKTLVNQAPLFDVFDNNGISFGDSTVYNSSSFIGSKLFSYSVGTGTDDPVLGFPIKYSALSNIGDINFDVSLNTETFDYTQGVTPVTQNVNTGYVYNYDITGNYTRMLGWQTAIAPSTQYQVFNYSFDILNPTNTYVCDVPVIETTNDSWPTVQVFYNNVYQEPSNYTVDIFDNSTAITLVNTPAETTLIQVLVLSNQVSSNAYYSIPVNLSNNPLNQELTTVDLGDIRSQYMDMFINAPNTTGDMFGNNNSRDCGNLVPYGTKIIQNSAALTLPGIFLRKQQYNISDALLFNSREYVKYKQLLVDTVQATDYTQYYTPSAILDDAIDQITSAKSQINAFFWTDMLPSKSPFRVNSYTFKAPSDITRYPLNKIYDFTSANYDGVLVYLSRTINNNRVEKQLIKNVDYYIEVDSPTVVVTADVEVGDVITIKEYNQTYGSYVPHTPTKLGLYKAYEPKVVYDTSYITPTYFIVGHDGSYTKLYGEYIAEADILVDFRDQALFEFEKRIYNNLKVADEPVIQSYEIEPGYFRTMNYNWDQWLELYSSSFLTWVGQNRIDYKTQFYNKNNPFTFNYENSGIKLDETPIRQGYYRGVYQYFYDTTTPDTTPWQLLGFTDMPSWWTERYGPAPYTNGNEILWQDLENGYVWNNGDPYTVSELARPGLSKVIPVDSNGDLLAPLYSIVGNYNNTTFQKDWKVGDMSPAEFSYRRSSSYPFDLIKILSITQPAKFYSLAVNLDNYKYSREFNQYLVNERSHLTLSDIVVYGDGTPSTSYINWIVDYSKQMGVDATADIKSVLADVDVRLVYRMAGYSDKSLLNFYVEKDSPNSNNSALLIPDDSYSILLYDNQPYDKLVFSSVVIQKNAGYWSVYGNSQTFTYFNTYLPLNNGSYETITSVDQTVKVAKDYTTKLNLVPYGTKFYSTQELAQFLMNYNAYLQDKGMKFLEVVDGTELNWKTMIQEMLYWVQTGWENGSIITLNPSANDMTIDKVDTVVQPLTVQNQNFILNQNLYPINLTDMCVVRDGTSFNVHTINEGDALSYAQFNLSNFEHGIVFDNMTLFNDVIYNTITGLRQNRIYLRGDKSAEWNGTVNASGFILNQDNIREWSRELRYPKGVIVKYKNKYYTSLSTVEPSLTFNEQLWKVVDYNNIQKGMLPNSATRSYESTLYYNVDKANLEQDADLLSFSLIGYRPRDYLAIADLSDITQVNVYKNLIRNKGTRNATYAFKGANLPQGGIDYDIYENWAIKTNDYGGVLNDNFVEFNLNQNQLNGNPSIVSLTDSVYTPGSMQEVSINSLFNYGQPINNPDVLSTLPVEPYNILYPSAGYVNYDDVRMSSFYYGGLSSAVNSSGAIVPINDFYVRDYMWLANFKEKWNVFTWKPIGQVTQVTPNLNNTSTITFNKPHNLKRLDPLAIVNFASNVDGYYIVENVISLTEVTINLALLNNTNNNNPIGGNGIAMASVSQRVATPSEISNIDPYETEFTKNTVWVDENVDGQWAVYRKSINYQHTAEVIYDNSVNFGSAVAYDEKVGYLVSDPGIGKVYRYDYYEDSGYTVIQELSQGTSFGTTIVHKNNVYAISKPTNTPAVYVYILNTETVATNSLILYQEIPAPLGVTNWGTGLALSDDLDWLYISATDTNNVYVYRKNQTEFNAGYFEVGQTYTITELGDTNWVSIGAEDNKIGITFRATGIGSGTGKAINVTFEQSAIINGDTVGTIIGDNFGFAISTNHLGNIVTVSAPNKENSAGLNDWGSAFIFNRTVQNIDVSNNSPVGEPSTFTLAWTLKSSIELTASSTSSVTNRITCTSSMTSYSVNDPVMFTGDPADFGDSGIRANTVYYIASISGSEFSIKTSRNTSTPVNLVNETVSFSIYVQTDPLYVTVNGKPLFDNNYGVVDGALVITSQLYAGDAINVSDNNFVLQQTVTSSRNDRVNFQFGYAMDNNIYGSEILIGSPYEIDDNNMEGMVYRFTNAGAKFGTVIGIDECNVSTARTLFINGYPVNISGNAQSISNTINSLGISNVQASYTMDNRLIIQLVDSEIANINEKLMLYALSYDTFVQLGLNLYTNTQIIACPHQGPSQFGKAIKINENDSALIGAPVGTSYVSTAFDFNDDENVHNDTVFDNNGTRYVDSFANAGAVYMFDLLNDYNGSANTPGKFVLAQSLNSEKLDSELSPRYGQALDFTNTIAIIGSPNFDPVLTGGEITIYTNRSGLPDWNEYRQPASIVDITKVQNAQLFSASSNNTLVNLDYIDPLNGKLLGVVRENIDYISAVDPAKYTTSLNAQNLGSSWNVEQVGQIWFDTSRVRFVNYHQNDVVYNSKYWGTLFPGSDVAVYTWVASNVVPSEYIGPGVPYDVNSYCIGSTLNASNNAVPVYYFWARNTNIITRKQGKTLADTTIAEYIANPKNSGVSYMAPVLPNTFALYNSDEYINANDTVFHIGYATGISNDVSHTEYTLIRENFTDDFLPGLPTNNPTTSNLAVHGTYSVDPASQPSSLYLKMLDSMAGCTTNGQLVPNPYLPRAVQTGVLFTPSQSFFYNRLGAVKNYLQYANEILIQYPITELKPDITLLQTSGEFFNTSDYWEYIDWYAPGYDSSVRTTIQVPLYSDLLAITPPNGTLAKVEQNGYGFFEIYVFENNTWNRVGLENGTIQFSSYLWDYTAGNIGFGGDFYDSTPFDKYPSEETKYIVRALNEQIYTGELSIYRIKSLVLLFEYIQSETIESQNYLSWLNKTSLVDVSHTIRELKPYITYRSDYSDFLDGYLNEVKPYHVVIKEFLLKYTGTDVFEGDITDFDLPATYNPTYKSFITPELVYKPSTAKNQYEIDSTVWNNDRYSQWFNNRGLSLAVEDNFFLTRSKSYVAFNTTTMVVDNISGFPINGVITIGQEQIAYSSVDRALNMLIGLDRGYNGTSVATHEPGTPIFMNLPPVIVLDGGNGYVNPPRVTAVFDETKFPAPIEPALLRAVMNGDSVSEIEILNPGKGYMVLPEIVISPSNIIYFSNTNIDNATNTINIYAPTLKTGDIVQFKSGTNNVSPSKIVDRNWYYVNVLETVPSTIIALYSSYADAVNDTSRIEIASNGVSTDMSLSQGARAIAVTSMDPIRSDVITLKYDRTSYKTQIKNWTPDTFYGSFFAGEYNNSENVSSSSILLDSEIPDVNTILASAGGVVLEIAETANDRNLNWSSLPRYVSTTIASNDSIQLIPQDGNNPNMSELESTNSGTTLGFTKNMPVKFVGSVIGGLIENKVYYVTEVLNDVQFTVSETIDGPSITLVNASIDPGMLQCIVGEPIDTAIVTVNYPGIRAVTNTTAITNSLTVPMTLIGTGGAKGLYTELPVFFTGEVFGGIIENLVYYVTTVIDNETFTISETKTPTQTSVISTAAFGDIVTVDSTEGFSVNDPIIFTGTSFGNIVAGKLYYVSVVVSPTEINISETINGEIFTLTNGTGVLTLVNQNKVVQLTTDTGNMTMNVGLPVSPGQIDGQAFNFYNTSGQYPGIVSTDYSNLVNRNISATIGTNYSTAVNRIALDIAENDTTNFYVNMPIRFSNTFGGLVSGTTYYITEYSGELIPDPLNPGEFIKRPNIQVTITSTSSSGNVLTCASTASLYANMPIVFSGDAIGGLISGQQYFVKSITSSTEFTISDFAGGATRTLTSEVGSMLGTGDPYIKVSTSVGGPAISLTNNNSGLYSFVQFILATPEFDVSYILGGYRVIVTDPGSGFTDGNTISIPGTSVGGTSPANDITITVNAVNSTGEIIDVIPSGRVPSITEQYYVKVRTANTLELYHDPLLELPVNGLDLPFVGFTSATVTKLINSTDAFRIANTSVFNQYDAVEFTGSVAGVTAGQTYYIYQILSSTDFTVTTVPGDLTTLVTISSDQEVNFTVAKPGSFMYLPEPFYFNQSIVKYNNRIWECVVSNNDAEFVLGKWAIISADDYRINALDRVEGFYTPTINMPGLDLTQVIDGITFPDAIYQDNRFQPSEQFDIDVNLQDEPFYPSEVNTTSIAFDGVNYHAASNLAEYSAVISDVTSNKWNIEQLTNYNVNLTDIVFANDYYVITSSNPATPIFRSNDGVQWTATGYFTPYDSTPYDDTPYDLTSLSVASIPLNSVAYYAGYWVAVGENIVRSDDTYIWRQVTNFEPYQQYMLNGVKNVETTGFIGFVAVGSKNGSSVLLYSETGEVWTEVPSFTPDALYSVASDGYNAVTVGSNGVIYYSANGANWLGVNQVNCISVDDATDILNVGNTTGFREDDPVMFNNDFSSISAGETYYINNVVSATQVRLSTSPGGLEIALPMDSIPSGTFMTLVDENNIDQTTLRDVIYGNGVWIAVGENGMIKSSIDGLLWQIEASGTLETLNGIIYNEFDSSFTVVGANNTIIRSTDNGATWESISLFQRAEPFFTVKGADFPYGYGPEELVPGNITDRLNMLVNTRPGTNWPFVEYGHTGFNVVDKVYVPIDEFQTRYDFSGLVTTPAKVILQVIDGSTGLSTTLAETEYTVDWVNKIVILDSPLGYYPNRDSLRINVYEVGNGEQLVKSNTDTDAIRVNVANGFNEIYLNCNYSQDFTQGSGVIRGGTSSVQVEATATVAATNSIVCVGVNSFIINKPITFQGTTFGGILEDTVYYVKTIDIVTSSITVSTELNAGVAGATTILTDDAGSMLAIINSGNGDVWTDPIVVHNGNRLVLGVSGIVTKTSAGSNTITTSTTSGMTVDSPIMFCVCMFGNDIQPLTTYYIKSIVDDNEFIISETVGGPEVVLTDNTGSSMFVTNDYALGIQPNGVSAKLMFANGNYTNNTDYIVYSLFGETEPEQYSYSLPEVQYFIGDGIEDVFSLTNFVGGTNSENAIVEIDGVRLEIDQYSIDSATNTITFVSIPANGAIIGVTTFNDTAAQYLSTMTIDNANVASVIGVNNNIVTPLATGFVTDSTTGTNTLLVGTPNGVAGFVVDQTIVFTGTSFGGIDTSGTVYFIDTIDIINNTFTIKDYLGAQISLTTDAGLMNFVVGEVPTVRITTNNVHGFTTNDIVKLDGLTGATQLNGNSYYARVVTPYVFDLYTEPFNVDEFNYGVVGVNNYVSGGYTWKTGTFYLATTYATATSSLDNYITADSVTDLVTGTVLYFNEPGNIYGATILGGLIQGQAYYVKDIDLLNSAFTVSETRYGDVVVLSSDTGNINVSQWPQSNVDRLWVTINGYRVQSSDLRIDNVNELSILTEITATDVIMITSMIPTATPNQQIYMTTVDKYGVGTVYNTDNSTRTFTTLPVYDLSTVIYVEDVSRIVNTVVQTDTVPSVSDDYYTIGLTANKQLISGITVYNNSTNQVIDSQYVTFELIDIAPVIKIVDGPYITEGDELTITVVEGNIIYVNGEEIKFSNVNFETNSLSGISRGVNGTFVNPIIPTYSVVFGMLPNNKLDEVYYNDTWNSYVYNPVLGDPLQISTTAPAIFLNGSR